jgi:hypothetical protein
MIAKYLPFVYNLPDIFNLAGICRKRQFNVSLVRLGCGDGEKETLIWSR